MTVNKLTILKPITNDQEVVIPVEMKWDFADRSDALIDFEKQAIKDILNTDKDFETSRFEFEGTINLLTGAKKTDINYEFNFVPDGATISTASWSPSYVVQGFTPEQVYYYANSFKKSFFKLDFYDTPDLKVQTNYITVILPLQQGEITTTSVGWNPNLEIKTPIFSLDYLGNLEGYFIYWLKNFDILQLDTFFMSAKFFDAKNGFFIKMMNRPQSSLVGNKFNFPQDKYFYYKVKLNYTNYTYAVYDVISSGKVGSSSYPIKWYEYINP